VLCVAGKGTNFTIQPMKAWSNSKSQNDGQTTNTGKEQGCNKKKKKQPFDHLIIIRLFTRDSPPS
jgi:hypothetical protein